MTHPNESRLALYAGDDLPLLARFRIASHVLDCDRCTRQVEELRGMRDWMRLQEHETPDGVRWEALASEIKANIRLGLAAGRCVDVPEALEEPHGFRWPAPAMALPVLLLVIAGWMLQSMQPALQPASADYVVDASSAGIGVQRDGRGFTLLQPRGENVVLSVNGEAAGARYVDSETGQVTISHVCAQ